MFLPILRAGNRLLPAGVKSVTGVGRDRRFEFSLQRPIARHIGRVVPVPHGQPGQICRPERCRFRNDRPAHFRPEDVGLELHERVIDACPAVDLQLFQFDARISLHGLEQIARLIGHRFDGRPRNTAPLSYHG